MNPYIDITDATEMARFGLSATMATAPRVLEASLMVKAYLGRDLSVQDYESIVDVAAGGYLQVPMIPLISIQSITGRYLPVHNHERRAVNSRVESDPIFMFATELTTMGGIPQPVPVDLAQCDVNLRTGRIWIPLSYWIVRFSEAEVKYTAGMAVIPDELKMAVAKIIPNIAIRPNSNFLKLKEGTTAIEFTAAFIPDEVKLLLDAFKKRWFA